MNPIQYFQPLPTGTTTATLRRLYSIKPHIQTGNEVIVRVYATESASALQQLLERAFSQHTFRVFVYPVAVPEAEVTLVQAGTIVHLQRCNIEPTDDILKPTTLDEAARRQWRTVIASYLKEPYLIDLPTPETNALLLRWLDHANAMSTTSVLMDDIIDAIVSMIQAKQDHPYEEAYVKQTTAVAGVLFAGSMLQQSAIDIEHKVALARLAYGPGVASHRMETELDRFIWEPA